MKTSTELGNFISAYTTSSDSQLVRLGFSLIGFAGIFLFSIVSLTESVKQNIALTLIIGAFNLASISGAIFFSRQYWYFRRNRISIYDYGLMLGNRDLHWDEIASYEFRGIHLQGIISLYCRLILYDTDHQKYVIHYGYYEYNKILLNSLFVRITEALGNRCISKIQQEGSITFGETEITVKGISQGENFLQWGELIGFVVRTNELFATRDDGTGINIKYNDPLDYSILFSLLDMMLLAQPDREYQS